MFIENENFTLSCTVDTGQRKLLPVRDTALTENGVFYSLGRGLGPLPSLEEHRFTEDG